MGKASRKVNAYKKYVNDVGKCELCGSKWNLELHHIIPLCVSDTMPELESEDNYVCLCGKCHARLTPKGILTKFGLYKKGDNRAYRFYRKLNNLTNAGERLSVCDVLDIFDEYFM